MLAFNKRLNHKAKVSSIDFNSKKVGLVLPNSNPEFIYTEQLSNVEILEDTGVELNGSIYVNDKVTDGKETYVVRKVPGGYFPFMLPNKKEFRRI